MTNETAKSYTLTMPKTWKYEKISPVLWMPISLTYITKKGFVKNNIFYWTENEKEYSASLDDNGFFYMFLSQPPWNGSVSLNNFVKADKNKNIKYKIPYWKHYVKSEI